jgi:hypothetical protein
VELDHNKKEYYTGLVHPANIPDQVVEQSATFRPMKWGAAKQATGTMRE